MDLKIIKAEKLRPNEIFSLFTSPLKFETITERNSIFIIGPKGSGKSMILNYLSLPVQLERLKTKNQIDYDSSNFGIYVRCNAHYFGADRENEENDDEQIKQWKNKFAHLFNVTICEKLFSDIESAQLNNFIKIKYSEEQKFIKEISRLFNFNNINSISKMKDILRQTRYDFSQNRIFENQFLTQPSTLSEIEQILQENINDFSQRDLVILLDEYHELSSAQQEIISDIISVRKPIFKIATVPSGFTTERTHTNSSLDLNQDFQVVELGVRNITPDSNELTSLKEFLVNMINKRLENFNITIENLLGKSSTSEIIPGSKINYYGLENYVLLSSGNAQYFLDLINTTIIQNNMKENFIPINIQDRSVRIFARQKMEEIEYIPDIQGYILRSIILKIGLLFRNYFRETGRSYIHVGIKDPENLSNETKQHFEIAIRRSYLLPPFTERYSRDSVKLYSITLHNSLLPYYDLPLRAHQIREFNASEIEKLLDKNSKISGTKIKTDSELKVEKPKKTLTEYFEYVDDIVTHIKNKDVVLFVGSGLSSECGFPTGKELTKLLAETFNLGYVGEDLSLVSSRILSNRSRGDLIKAIKRIFRDSIKNLTLIEKLSQLNFDVIYTTNWDTVLEDTFKKNGHQVEKIVRDNSLSSALSNSTIIYKIHGDFEHPDLFVITEEDERLVFEKKPVIMTSLLNDLARKHFLFIGYGMEDWDFTTLINLIKTYQGKFQLSSYSTVTDVSEKNLKLLRENNILPLQMKGGELIEILSDKIGDAPN